MQSESLKMIIVLITILMGMVALLKVLLKIKTEIGKVDKRLAKLETLLRCNIHPRLKAIKKRTIILEKKKASLGAQIHCPNDRLDKIEDQLKHLSNRIKEVERVQSCIEVVANSAWDLAYFLLSTYLKAILGHKKTSNGLSTKRTNQISSSSQK